MEMNEKNSNYCFLWALEMKALREFFEYICAVIILFEINSKLILWTLAALTAKELNIKREKASSQTCLTACSNSSACFSLVYIMDMEELYRKEI